MKHAVIVAHPNPESLCLAIAETYRDSAESMGQDVLFRDLYRIGFDPCLKSSEIPHASGWQFGADVVAERELLADVDVFAFVYPLWFNAPPAMMKGYVDRVFSMGFGFGPGMGGSEPLLTGRRMISFTTSGAPEEWVRGTGALQALMALFDRHVSQMCGLEVIDHVHTGGVVSNMTDQAFESILESVRATVKRCFGGVVRHEAG